MGIIEGDSVLYSKVESVAINPGANFLEGKATSAFTSANNVLGENLTTASNVNNIAGKGLEAPGKGLEAVNAGMNSAGLMAEVTQKGISYLTGEVSAYSSVVVKKLLAIPLDEIVSYGTEMTPKFIKSVGEIKDELLTPAETRIDTDNEKIEIEDQKQINNKIGKKISEFAYKCNNFLGKCSYGLDTIVSYINAGPDWLNNKINKFVAEKLEDFKKETAENLTKDSEEKKQIVKDKALQYAQGAAEKINEKQKKVVKEAVDLEKKIKKKAEHIVKAAIAQANMFIKGLLGG